jgi:hypothetical protein
MYKKGHAADACYLSRGLTLPVVSEFILRITVQSIKVTGQTHTWAFIYTALHNLRSYIECSEIRA